jgi:methionine sulfoxide reductase heme-binding subunit
LTIGVLKTLVFCGALLPLVWVVYRGFTGDLTANPIEYITHHTGWFALMFLTVSLSVTPLRRLTGWQSLIRFRRMLGLFAFFYGLLHFSIWFALDRFFSVAEMANDVVKRPFITAGMTALLCMLPLAVTSTTGMIRRLGGKRWRRLHRLAYVAAAAAVVHFWWLVKSDIREPRRWAIAVAVLLGLRAWWMFQARSSSRS